MLQCRKFQIGQDSGLLLENVVAVELLRRKIEFYYLRNGYEADFVVRRQGKVVQLIQVCYSLSDPRTKKRETAALQKAGKQFGCRNLTVLTWDEEGYATFNSQTVRLLPVWKWLLHGSQ